MIKDTLISILERFCPDEVYLQGTLNPDETYAASFITYYITDSEFNEHYDDVAGRTDWDVSVMYYSNDPLKVQSIPPLIIRALRDEGFIPKGAGHDLISDDKSHTGWAMDFVYPEINT